MYKFTNGLVFYDETTAKKYQELGYKLVDEIKPSEKIVDSQNEKSEVTVESIDKSIKSTKKSVRKN